MKKLKNILKVVCLLPLAAAAQNDNIETDRPSESFSPAIVLKNHFQVEAGFRKEYDNNEGERSDEYLYPSALLKYGLTKKLELRMLIEEEADYDYTPDKHKTAGGLEPIKVGLKYNLFDEKGALPKTSLIARGDIPMLSSPDFKSDFVAPLFRLAMENSLTKKLSIIYNIGEEWEEDDVHGEFFYSISPQFEVSEKFKVFAEVFGYISKDQAAKNTFDAGLLYQVTPNLQFDIFGGTAISKNAPDNFIELGISFRLPK
ncbi:MAG: transporter [Segetibacter sp.]